MYARQVFPYVLIFFLFPGFLVFSQIPNPQFRAIPDKDRWSVVTRWDYRVWKDGHYVGYANRELREVFHRQEERPEGWLVTGDARLLGETKKNGVAVVARLEKSASVNFTLGHNGTVTGAGNNFPRLRGFPTFPEEELAPGDYWEAPLDILILGPDGEHGVLNQIASYKYLGLNPYRGRDAQYFEVQWAIRYRGGNNETDRFVNTVEGSHQVTLVIDAASGTPIMARDHFRERWHWINSSVENRDGFALIFWNGVPPLDTSGIKKTFKEKFGAEAVIISEINESDNFKDIVITETSLGLSVTLGNLHFQPDLDLIVPEDTFLIDELAGILKGIPDRTILVRGHTADVGRPVDEHTLSEKRARTIAEELSRRGIDSRRLIYEGLGADEPLVSNASESGRKQNRRVELLILED